MKAAHPQDAVETWCSDEARFGLQALVRRVWAPRGERPVAHVAPDYEWLWLYAAAHPASGENFWLSLARLETEMVQLFLDEFAKAPAARISISIEVGERVVARIPIAVVVDHIEIEVERVGW